MVYFAPSSSWFSSQPLIPETAQELDQGAAETTAHFPAKDAKAVDSSQSEAAYTNQSMLYQDNSFHAQNLPLRGRDFQVLKELFSQHGIEAIESDILENLGWRCPEPCWEDNPFEFLREYL